jgi:hypothetical protein
MRHVLLPAAWLMSPRTGSACRAHRARERRRRPAHSPEAPSASPARATAAPAPIRQCLGFDGRMAWRVRVCACSDSNGTGTQTMGAADGCDWKALAACDGQRTSIFAISSLVIADLGFCISSTRLMQYLLQDLVVPPILHSHPNRGAGRAWHSRLHARIRASACSDVRQTGLGLLQKYTRHIMQRVLQLREETVAAHFGGRTRRFLLASPSTFARICSRRRRRVEGVPAL